MKSNKNRYLNLYGAPWSPKRPNARLSLTGSFMVAAISLGGILYPRGLFKSHSIYNFLCWAVFFVPWGGFSGALPATE